MSDHRSDHRRPQGGGPDYGYRDNGQPGDQPRPTRAEMRRAAQAANKRSNRRRANSERRPDNAGGGPGRKRFIDYPRSGRYGMKRWIPSWKQLLSGFVIACGVLIGGLSYAYATVSIPSVNPSTQLQNNIFYWDNGTQMASSGQVDRQNVSLDQVPAKVQWDFLAAENATFYSDPGIDLRGMLRAVYHMASGGNVQSGSTITQQFVKNTYLNQNQTVTRKLKEIIISLKIGEKLTKPEILQGYLNSNYYGRGAYGIEAASQAYYHEPVGKLNASQGAFLTATVNEPSVMMNADSDPKARKLAQERWEYVLKRMVAIHHLSEAERQHFLAAGFPTPKPLRTNGSLTGQTGYLVQLAEHYVESHAHLTDQQLNQGGYSVYTTFDKKKVNEMAASVAKMEKEHLDPSSRSADKNVQVGAASVDPRTGAIEAVYGGAGYDKKYFLDNADSSGVAVGSTFKPFDLAAALDHGAVLTPGAQPSPITPDSKFNADNGIKIKNQQGQYLPDGSDPTGLLHQQNDVPTAWGYVTLRKAMEQSINTPYVQLGEYVGYDKVENEALSAGLLRSSLQYDTAGFFIGTSTPSPIRMADAYGTFADNGTHHEPYSVTKVLKGGQALPGFGAPAGTQAMPASTASNVTDVLQDVVKYGTGTHARVLGRPVAGKTGTTDDYKSAWFIGYTPQMSTAVEMFKEKPSDGKLESMEGVGGYSKVFGADMPTQVWTGYMLAALSGQPVLNFQPPQQLGKGTNEPGAPSPSPSASTTPSATPSGTPCSQLTGGCGSPAPSPSQSTPGSTQGLLGGMNGGTSPGPSTRPSRPGRPGRSNGGANG